MVDGVQIALIDNRAVVRLTSWQLAPFPDEAKTSCTSPLVPPYLGTLVRPLSVGPGEWLMVSDVVVGASLRYRLDQHLTDYAIAAVDLSSGVKPVRVEGSAARALLSKGCGLDLHPKLFPALCSTRTRFAQLSVILDCVDPTPQYDLYVTRSYVSYLISWLEDAALEFK